jgi:hypothetical protein
MNTHIERARNLLELLDGRKLMHEDHASCLQWLHEITSGKLMICEWKRNAAGQYYIHGLESPKENERPDTMRTTGPRAISVVAARSAQ